MSLAIWRLYVPTADGFYALATMRTAADCNAVLDAMRVARSIIGVCLREFPGVAL